MTTLFDPPRQPGEIRLRPYQEQAASAVDAARARGLRSGLIVLATGGGKCLGRGTPVMRFDGSVVPVEDIVAGDLLMGPDSLPRVVLSTCQGVEPLYRVVPTKGESYVVNESHILSVKLTPRRHGEKHTLQAISVLDYLAECPTFKHRAKGWRAAVDWDHKPVPVDPYLLGLWLGDGTSDCPSFTTPDPEIVEYLEAYANAEGYRLRHGDVSGKSRTYHLVQGRTGRGHVHAFRAVLWSLGLMPEKFVPLIYRANSREIRSQILAGIIDTDGYCHQKGCDLMFKPRRLADDTAFLARSLGLAAYVTECQKTCTNTGATGTYWRVNISGDFTFLPLRVPRRKVEARTQIKSVNVTGIRLEPIGPGEYFGFELSGPDRLFLLGDFTVTHNTTIFSHLIGQEAKRGGRSLILAHRDELVEQAADRISSMTDVRVDIEGGDRKAIGTAEAVVASVQTIGRAGSSRLGWLRPTLIVTDECHHACFVAGTLIDGRPIEKLRIGDSIKAYDHWRDEVTDSSVSAVMRRVPAGLLRIVFENGAALVCTSNHPIYGSKDGKSFTYVSAGRLKVGDTALSTTNEREHTKEELHQAEDLRDLRDGAPAEKLESDDGAVLLGSVQGVSAGCPEEADHAALPEVRDARHLNGQWLADDSADDVGGGVGTPDGIRGPDCGCGEPIHGSSAPSVQDRHRGPGPDAGDRGRRERALCVQSESQGRVKDPRLECTRVASVEVLEPGSDGRFGGLCPDGFVYNLSVNTHHNYYANGILVHNCADTYQSVYRRFPCEFHLGVTATAHRMDNRPLHGGEAIYEAVLFEYGIKPMIMDGWLCDIRAYRCDASYSLQGVKTTAGDYNQKDLDKRVNTNRNNIEALAYWAKVATGRRTIVFCTSVDHAHAMADLFVDQGIVAEAVDGTMDKGLRAGIMARFKSGETQVLCNMNIATEGFDCLDSETEVLTGRGWVGMNDIDQTDYVYSLNRTTERVELVPIDRIVRRPVVEGERMAVFESQHFDIRVTEGHEFHIKQRSRGAAGQKWYVKSGRALTELTERRAEFRLPLAGVDSKFDEYPKCSLTDDEIRFIGWFLTDGCVERGAITISQSEKKHHEHIRALLTRLGFDFSERLRENKTGFEGGASCYEFRIPKGTGSGSLARNGHDYLSPYLDKSIPITLEQLSPQQFKVLWDEMMLGNGARKANASGWLWMPRKEQADRLTAMAVKRGFATSCAIESTPSGGEVWRITVRDRKWMSTYPSDPRSTRITLQDPKPGEEVWCVSNRNSTLITRRGGKVVIIGNCPEASCVLLLRPTKSWSLFVQMIGRGLRTAPGKQDCIVIDVEGAGDDKSLASVPGVLGLPPTVSQKGDSFKQLAMRVDALPDDLRARLGRRPFDLASLDSVLAEVDLLRDLGPSEDIVNGSDWAWQTVADGWYSLWCGSDETKTKTRKATLRSDVLGTWTLDLVEGDGLPVSDVVFEGIDPSKALHAADNAIRLAWPGLDGLLRRDAPWRNKTGGASDKQKFWLRKFGLTDAEIAQMTRSEVSTFLDRQFSKRRR